MNVFLAILGGIVLLAIVLFLCIVAAAIQAEMCKECPFKKECDAHQHDDNFAPEYYKHRTMFPHNPMDHSL